MNTFGNILGALVISAVSVTTAFAADYSYTSALTADSPSFVRPLRSFGDYRYSAVGFTASTSGLYQVTTQAPTYDGYLFLYAGSFDARNPSTNLLQSSDDGTNFMNSSLSAQLQAGVNYYAVNTTYSVYSSNAFAYPNAAGFTTTISGPGSIAPLAAVPEPETYAMLLAGLGLMGYVVRRRKPVKPSQASSSNLRAIV
jgi:hypothetical protein